MTAIAAGTILTAGLGAYKVIDGANQKAQANRLAQNNILQPEQIPGQVKQATQLAAQNYYNGMPGQQNALNNIQRNAGNAMFQGSRGASSGGDILDLASKINVGENAATNDLSAKAAEYRAQAAGAYENALNNAGGYQDKLYKNNVLDPYLRTANTAASLYGAGAQNQFSGLDTIGTAALGYANAASRNNAAPGSPGSRYNSDGSMRTMGQYLGTQTPQTGANIGLLPGQATPVPDVSISNPIPQSPFYDPYSKKPLYMNVPEFNLPSTMAAASLAKSGY